MYHSAGYRKTGSTLEKMKNYYIFLKNVVEITAFFEL